MLRAAKDENGKIQKGSLGCYDLSYLEENFPSFTHVELCCDIPEDYDGDNYDIAEVEVEVESKVQTKAKTKKKDAEYESKFTKVKVLKLVKKAAAEIWHLEISGSDTVQVEGVETYTVKKVDEDGKAVAVGTETVKIKTSRGLLSTQSLTLVKGKKTFTLTAVNETVSSNITVICGDKNASKAIEFVL